MPEDVKKIIIKNTQTDKERKQEKSRLKRFVISSIVSLAIGALIGLVMVYIIRLLINF